jgi:hypothetical protein
MPHERCSHGNGEGQHVKQEESIQSLQHGGALTTLLHDCMSKQKLEQAVVT